MFGVIEKIIIAILLLRSGVNPLKCISMMNQKCKVRPKVINNDLFYPFSIKVNKSSGNCNNINDPYSKECVPDVVRNLNLKVFNMVEWKNKTIKIKWHKSCHTNAGEIKFKCL